MEPFSFALVEYQNERDGHCVKSVRIQSYSGPYFAAFGLKMYHKNVPQKRTCHIISLKIKIFNN